MAFVTSPTRRARNNGNSSLFQLLLGKFRFINVLLVLGTVLIGFTVIRVGNSMSEQLKREISEHQNNPYYGNQNDNTYKQEGHIEGRVFADDNSEEDEYDIENDNNEHAQEGVVSDYEGGQYDNEYEEDEQDSEVEEGEVEEGEEGEHADAISNENEYEEDDENGNVYEEEDYEEGEYISDNGKEYEEDENDTEYDEDENDAEYTLDENDTEYEQDEDDTEYDDQDDYDKDAARHTHNYTSSHQVLIETKMGKKAIKDITTITKDSFMDLRKEFHSDEKEYTKKNVTFEDALKGRERIWDILQDAGIKSIDVTTMMNLPTWEEVTYLYGDKPVVVMMDRNNRMHRLETSTNDPSSYKSSCDRFRNEIPKEDAFIGVAGLYNTGTNALKLYLMGNMKMPHNDHKAFVHKLGMSQKIEKDGDNEQGEMDEDDKDGVAKGILGSVPWQKHWFPSYRFNFTGLDFRKGKLFHGIAQNRTHVLPVVMVRDPYTWIQSMCKVSYDIRWKKTGVCPSFPRSNIKKVAQNNVENRQPNETKDKQRRRRLFSPLKIPRQQQQDQKPDLKQFTKESRQQRIRMFAPQQPQRRNGQQEAFYMNNKYNNNPQYPSKVRNPQLLKKTVELKNKKRNENEKVMTLQTILDKKQRLEEMKRKRADHMRYQRQQSKQQQNNQKQAFEHFAAVIENNPRGVRNPMFFGKKNFPLNPGDPPVLDNKVHWEALNSKRTWDSIIQIWNEYYNEYVHADFPRIIVRFEDLLYHSKEVTQMIQNCAGAVPIRKDGSFAYVVDRSKFEQDGVKFQSNMISAMIKHTSISRRFHRMDENALRYAKEHLDSNLMDLFHYQQEQNKQLHDKG